MTIPKTAAAALLMCVASIGWSQTSPVDHAAHHPPAMSDAAPGQMMMASADELAASRELLDKAEHAKSAAERERLLGEHLAAMRKQLDSLKSRECMMQKMDGAPMGAGRPDGAKPGMMPDMKMGAGMQGDHEMMCHPMMKSRMDTLAELLEQTWRREELRKKGAK